MDSWFIFYLDPSSSEADVLEELKECRIEHPSFLEDLETGQKQLYAIADSSRFTENYRHITSWTSLANPSIDWETQWSHFCPYFSEGEAKIPLSNFCDTSEESLTLLPGSGFGDLSHPTTTLTLQTLSKYCKNQVIIDLGCGSGVLGLAALKWGSSFVYALDIDPGALDHTQANAIHNQLDEKILIGSILPEDFPVLPSYLVMNMTFEDQKKAIESLTFIPSLWITSGILKEQEKEYLYWVNEIGFMLIDSFLKDGWACYRLKKIKDTSDP